MFKNRSINTKSTKSVKRPRNMFIVIYWKGNDNCGPCVKTFFFFAHFGGKSQECIQTW